MVTVVTIQIIIGCTQFSQFEIAFLASTRCLCVCLFCMQVDMLCYCNVQLCMPEQVIQIQHTIQNTNIWPWQFERHILQICKSNLTTQLLIIITGLLNPHFCMQCIGIFQRWQTKVDMSIPKCTIICGTHSDIQWMPKTISIHENGNIFILI